jgi:N-acetyl-anhydromuramyl-L-alanine amidase AmpD
LKKDFTAKKNIKERSKKSIENMLKLNPEKIKYLIVHHTATNRDRTTFEAVKRYHTQVRGWEDIGYHWFINGKGELKKGRDEQWVGAHCKTPGYSMNFQSLGIALTGNFEIENPAKEQIATLDDLLGRLRTKYSIPKENVLGHKEAEGTSTLCPGKNFLPYLRTYRKRVEKPEPEKDKRSLALEEIIKVLKKYELIP